MFTFIFNRFTAFMAAIGAFAMVLGVTFLRGRRSGQQAYQERILKQTQRQQEKFNEIDRERPDLDGALGRLRDRTQGGDVRPRAPRPSGFHSGRVGGKRKG